MFNKLKIIKRKIQNRLKEPVIIPPSAERDIFVFPPQGQNISVETCLNSRCSSDYDNAPHLFHWGMFDTGKVLSREMIETIVNLAKICRFTDKDVHIEVSNNVLSFIIDNTLTGYERDFLMIESGMQQQSVALVCAALGVGNVLINQGKDGRPCSPTALSTIKMKVDPMKPSYAGSFWTSSPPDTEARWQSGNLPDPAREGYVPILAALSNLCTERSGQKTATRQSLGQLLWAACGRTPHLYKSTPWGMTIPTWECGNASSMLYVVLNAKLYAYLNWARGRPTHIIRELASLKEASVAKLHRLPDSSNSFLILGTHVPHAFALWETGYQLLNILVQSYSLGINYRAILLDEEGKDFLSSTIRATPMAIIFLDLDLSQSGEVRWLRNTRA